MGTERDLMRWRTMERDYSMTRFVFTKREFCKDERIKKADGSIYEPPWSRERLQNEEAALEFIGSETSIPVPRVVRSYIDNGAFTLETTVIPGISVDELEGEDKYLATIKIKYFVERTMLPQLKHLKSEFTGSLLDHLVIPHSRIYSRDKRRTWPSRSSSIDFGFCHGDLAQNNFLLDKETLDIVGVLDWEYSGFYPPQIEYPYYLMSTEEVRQAHVDTNRLIGFLLGTGEINLPY